MSLYIIYTEVILCMWVMLHKDQETHIIKCNRIYTCITLNKLISSIIALCLMTVYYYPVWLIKCLMINSGTYYCVSFLNTKHVGLKTHHLLTFIVNSVCLVGIKYGEYNLIVYGMFTELHSVILRLYLLSKVENYNKCITTFLQIMNYTSFFGIRFVFTMSWLIYYWVNISLLGKLSGLILMIVNIQQLLQMGFSKYEKMKESTNEIIDIDCPETNLEIHLDDPMETNVM